MVIFPIIASLLAACCCAAVARDYVAKPRPAGAVWTVAIGGSLTRLGSRQFLYIAMSVGIAQIFTGYLRGRQPDTGTALAPRGSRHTLGQPGSP